MILEQEDNLGSFPSLQSMDQHHHHKKPKLEKEEESPPPIPAIAIDDEDDRDHSSSKVRIAEEQREGGGSQIRGGRESIGVGGSCSSFSSSLQDKEQEEALLALIDHRSKEVQLNKQKAAYYQSQVEISERKLSESQLQLARLRSSSKSNGCASAKVGARSSSSAVINGHEQAQPSRPQLVIPALSPKILPSQVPARVTKPASTPAITSRTNTSPSAPSNILGRPKRDPSTRPISEKASAESQQKKTKSEFAQKDHKDLIPSIRISSSPRRISFQSGIHISSQHKRKLRSLVLNPVNDQIFITSALDGVVNLWHVQIKGPSASLLSTTDCVSPKQRRWPEDITWHPDGDSLFAAYSADAADSQISVLNLNLSGDKKVAFLPEKPHLKGIINSIIFMPWSDLCFATGGSDHAVILWNEKDDSWKPKMIHRNEHSSAVMGVAGLQQKKVMLSVGADKRIVGFDLLAGRSEFKHQIESKCMSVLPNPSDFNLFLVQTGAPGKQLRLFDVRLRKTEIHAFGWKQESSESQSALINQAWSPDGLYVSSGSADPMIHIFDIRYNGHGPSQSVQAHQKRVFKAVWHQSLPLLTSISSDLNIGLHKIS